MLNACIITLSFISYTYLQRYDILSIGIDLFILIFLLCLKGNANISYRINPSILFILCFVSSTVTLYTCEGKVSTFDAGKNYLYGLSLVLGLTKSWLLIQKKSKIFFYSLIFLGVSNGIVALMQVFGIIDYTAFTTNFNTRKIFFTPFSSANGIMYNSNAFAATQSALAIVILFYCNHHSIKNYIHIGHLTMISSILGASRGVAGSVILFYLIYFILQYKKLNGSKKIIITTLFSVPLVGFLLLEPEQINYEKEFRINKGLNGREEVWMGVKNTIYSNIFFGTGATSEVIQEDLGNRSMHSAYLNTLFRGGIFLFIITYSVPLLAFYHKITHVFKGNNIENALICATIIYYLAMSSVRTYSVGGTGILPIVLSISASLALKKYNTGIREAKRKITGIP